MKSEIEDVGSILCHSVDEVLGGDVAGLGDGLGYLVDGGGVVVGLDEQAVERCGCHGGGVEAGPEREIETGIDEWLCHAWVASHAVNDPRHCAL